MWAAIMSFARVYTYMCVLCAFMICASSLSTSAKPASLFRLPLSLRIQQTIETAPSPSMLSLFYQKQTLNKKFGAPMICTEPKLILTKPPSPRALLGRPIPIFRPIVGHDQIGVIVLILIGRVPGLIRRWLHVIHLRPRRLRSISRFPAHVPLVFSCAGPLGQIPVTSSTRLGFFCSSSFAKFHGDTVGVVFVFRCRRSWGQSTRYYTHRVIVVDG